MSKWKIGDRRFLLERVKSGWGEEAVERAGKSSGTRFFSRSIHDIGSENANLCLNQSRYQDW
jgi:hypothetical protein